MADTHIVQMAIHDEFCFQVVDLSQPGGISERDIYPIQVVALVRDGDTAHAIKDMLNAKNKQRNEVSKDRPAAAD